MVESVQRCAEFMRLLREQWPEHDRDLAARQALKWLSQMLVHARQINKDTSWHKLRLLPLFLSAQIVRELGILQRLRLLKRALE